MRGVLVDILERAQYHGLDQDKAMTFGVVVDCRSFTLPSYREVIPIKGTCTAPKEVSVHCYQD